MKKLWYAISLLGILLIFLHLIQIKRASATIHNTLYKNRTPNTLTDVQKENLKKYLNDKKAQQIRENLYFIP